MAGTTPWYTFLAFLLITLATLRKGGDTAWVYGLIILWTVPFLMNTELGRDRETFVLSYLFVLPSVYLLIGVRFRQWLGLTRNATLWAWVALFGLYVTGTALLSLLVPDPGVYKRLADDHYLPYAALGMLLIGFFPLAAYWLLTRLEILRPSQER